MAMLLSVFLVLPGCRGATIEQTEVPDTEENRILYAQVMAYRDAMERRDIEAIMALVSRNYYENAGTTDRDEDDYGYEELRDEVIPKLLDNVKVVQYRLLLRRIEVDSERAFVDYEYFYRFKFSEGGNDGWAQRNDFNRLEFLMENGTWKIVAGL